MLLFFLAATVLSMVQAGVGETPATGPIAGTPANAPWQTMPARTVPQPPPGAQPPPLPVTQIEPGPEAATLDSPRHLTLGFAEPRPIEEVLRLLVEGTPFSLAIDPDVSGVFRGTITNLTLREALTTLLT